MCQLSLVQLQATQRQGNTHAGRAVHVITSVHNPLTPALQNPQLQNQPLNAVPEYGGSSSNSANAVSFSGGPILTPQQILERLNDHVVGQESVKRVSL